MLLGRADEAIELDCNLLRCLASWGPASAALQPEI